MRLFLALEPPADLRSAIWERVAAARAATGPGRGARWVREEGVHLTLEFLGEVAEGALRSLTSACQTAGEAGRAFVARVARGGWFPAERSARVLWLGLEAGDELAALQSRFAAAARRALAIGPTTGTGESRPFHAHLTLARCDPPWPRRAAEEFVAYVDALAGLAFPVSEVVLLRSQLGPGGSRYEAAARFPLGGPTP